MKYYLRPQRNKQSVDEDFATVEDVSLTRLVRGEIRRVKPETVERIKQALIGTPNYHAGGILQQKLNLESLGGSILTSWLTEA